MGNERGTHSWTLATMFPSPVMIQPKPGKPGRPPFPPGERAASQIQLRVTAKRKAAYVRAAQPGTLASWCFEHLDKAAEYREQP